jgi:cytochrome c biogenesis protein CcmG, thiol:disulfide interchange protein DsbE
MKNSLILALCLFLGACADNVNQEVGMAVANVSTEAKAPVRDTIPPPVSNNVMMDTARPDDKIKKTFPYDIPLKNAKGDLLNSAQALHSNGKPTILLFWLTTCAPCAMEMQAISTKYNQWKKETDFNLIAISTDFSKNYPNFVKRVEEKKWPWQTYIDVDREFRKVMPGELNGLPQTFVLDKNGNIVLHKRKYSTGDEDQLFEQVKALAAK